jgi:tRNA nucleotidyltransferase (CCA-adding enzyme)
MDYLTKSILLELLNFSTSQNKKIFVVGGTVRDYLSRKPCSDFDLTGKNAAKVGANFSRAFNFTCIHLDKTPGRNTVRVILDQNQHLDFTDLQGRNIEEDLSQRDFTINAMSLPLSEFLSGQKGIIDPYKGQEDLSKKKIRVLQGPIFSSDPLRMLRAFRFAATLIFEIDVDTLNNISLHKEKLSKSAPERIWHELTLFFKVAKTLPLLKSMFECGLLDYIYPASSIDLDRYEKMESLLNDPREIFPEYVDKFNTDAFLDKHYLIKISVLKNVNQEFNLRLSNAESQLLEQALNGTKSLTQVYLKSSPDQNETYELILSIHEELLASLILFITDSDGSDIGERTFFCTRILKFYYDQFLPTMSEKPLLNGEDIIHQFQISPSPIFGRILNDIQKAQVLGKITTPKDALALAGNIIQSQTKESNG